MRSFKLADTCRRDNASSHRRAFPSSSLPSSDERTEVELVARGTAWATTTRGLPHRRNPSGVTHTKSIARFRAGPATPRLEKRRSGGTAKEIGRASCREGGCQYVSIRGGAGSL